VQIPSLYDWIEYCLFSFKNEKKCIQMYFIACNGRMSLVYLKISNKFYILSPILEFARFNMTLVIIIFLVSLKLKHL